MFGPTGRLQLTTLVHCLRAIRGLDLHAVLRLSQLRISTGPGSEGQRLGPYDPRRGPEDRQSSPAHSAERELEENKVETRSRCVREHNGDLQPVTDLFSNASTATPYHNGEQNTGLPAPSSLVSSNSAPSSGRLSHYESGEQRKQRKVHAQDFVLEG